MHFLISISSKLTTSLALFSCHGMAEGEREGMNSLPARGRGGSVSRAIPLGRMLVFTPCKQAARAAPMAGGPGRAAVASCRPGPYPEPLASLTGVKRRRPGQKGGVGAGEAGAPAWVVGVICEERRRAC